MQITFRRRYEDILDVAICFIWKSKLKDYKGIMLIGPKVELIQPDFGITEDSLKSHLLQQGFRKISAVLY